MLTPLKNDDRSIETDITIYGATSFVARHVLHYIRDVRSSLPASLKVTLAGRNESKLQVLKETYEAQMKAPAIASTSISSSSTTSTPSIALDVYVANSTDDVALQAMASRTKVVLNCAGPFALYSSGVVGACAITGCHYVDITGEVDWVGQMRVQHGRNSAQSGARIISLCGFDSIPSDMAIFAAVQAIQKCNNESSSSSSTSPSSFGVNVESATTWHECFGVAGGGTLATMKHMNIDFKKCLFRQESKKKSTSLFSSLRKVPYFLFDPLVLTDPEKVRFNPDFETTRNQMGWSEWMNQLPTIDKLWNYGISIPFFMAVANAKVVQASAIALKYGPNFTYKERFSPLGFDRTKRWSLLSAFPSLITMGSIMLGGLVVKLPIVGDIVLRYLAPPGTGGSDALCAKGFASVYAEVKAAAPSNSSKHEKNGAVYANSYMSFQGDPGNWVTAQCVTESALALVFNQSDLPPRSMDGFGTPAELLGNVLLQRLEQNTVRPVKLRTHIRYLGDDANGGDILQI